MEDVKSSAYTNFSTMVDATVPLLSDQKDSHVFIDTPNFDTRQSTNLSVSSKSSTDLPPVDQRCLEELRKAGIIAKPTIMYDESSPAGALKAFGGTALKTVLMRPEFWCVMILHIVLSYLYYEVWHNPVIEAGSTGQQQSWPFIAAATLTIPGSMLVFFLVFHTSQAYTRFFTQYLAYRAVESRTSRICSELRTFFPDKAFPEARLERVKIARWLISTMYLGLATLPEYQDNGVLDWAWQQVVDSQVLTVKEAQTLQALPEGYHAASELMSWVSQELYSQVEAGRLQLGVYSWLIDQLYEVGSQLTVLRSHVLMPVPFAFFHLQNFILIIYLLLLAYTYTMFSRYWSILAMFLTCLSLLGLRELACALSDPFGNDDTDLPIFDYVIETHAFIRTFIALPACTGGI